MTLKSFNNIDRFGEKSLLRLVCYAQLLTDLTDWLFGETECLILRGHSTTTWTKYGPILSPSPLKWTIVEFYMIPTLCDQVWTFYWPLLPLLVHVVIEWPLNWRKEKVDDGMIEISQQVAPLCLIVGIPFSPQPDSSINSRNQIDSFIIHAKNSSDISTNMADSLQDLNFRLGIQSWIGYYSYILGCQKKILNFFEKEELQNWSN